MSEPTAPIFAAKRAIESGALCLRSFLPAAELQRMIDLAFAEGRGVAILPTRQAMRSFYTPSGFASIVEEALHGRMNAEIVVPPGLYGGALVCVIRPMPSQHSIPSDTSQS
ncbi:hypothetical protein J5226_11430 [Lysobacter sp. K5869]|uniref:hypothetical protein n=1 Tax=Lysobacter sp. K5869 TaxID=2820808 RepID=UPI001C05FA25|nr:hypothetical protein [Lysobacter sp. K5869]QWP78954.1 hypothetical protein J5226_11430 [Lysobacter sp. K5869]